MSDSFESITNDENLTPEERIKQNDELTKQDSSNEMRVRATFNDEPLEKQREVLALNAQAAAERLTTELDTEYKSAMIFVVSRVTEQPVKRFLIIKSSVAVIEEVEIAVWPLMAQTEHIYPVYLGRDGNLYGIYSLAHQYARKQIDVDTLSETDTLAVSEAIDGLLSRQEMLNQHNS